MVELTAALVSILVGLLVLFPFLKKWWNKINNAQISQRLANMEEHSDKTNALVFDRLDKIVYELSFNGGSSIRDAVSRIEQRQLISSERQRSLMQVDARGIFEADLKGNFNWVNDTFLSITEIRDPLELKNHGWISFVHPDDREQVSKSWDHAVSDKRRFRCKTSFITKEGNKKPVYMDSHILRGKDDEPIGFIGFVTELENDLS